MFGIGTGEILVILLVALLVLGPNDIPKVARTIGRTMKDLQRFKDDLRRSVDLEFEEYEKSESEASERNAKKNQTDDVQPEKT